jgi:hypothetical protein
MRAFVFKACLKLRSWWLIWVFIFLCALRQSSLASLVIMIYHNETMYIAGDSAVTMIDTGERKGVVQKVYPFSINCCASITGFAGYDLTNSSGETGFTMRITDALGRACAQQMTNSVSLDQKMQAIADEAHQAFARYYDWTRQMIGGADHDEATMLQFAGYNAAKDCFFISSCKLGRTNAAKVELAAEYHDPNDAKPFSLQGEVPFLQALLSGDKPELSSLTSGKFKDTERRLYSSEAVTDEEVTNFIFEMYALHVANSARLGYSLGMVGPPYRIFKVTKQTVVELTSGPSAAATNSISAVGNLHGDDDKAIDAIMEKLAKTYKNNDYSYAFEVMYAPILESMGGKEKLLAAMPALKEQMDQLHVSLISWETQKPYSYLKGNGRWYAVIPYVSELNMTGQKFKVSGFEFGIKNDGSEWQFLDGQKLTPTIFDTFFPDFPKDVELPKTQRELE